MSRCLISGGVGTAPSDLSQRMTSFSLMDLSGHGVTSHNSTIDSLLSFEIVRLSRFATAVHNGWCSSPLRCSPSALPLPPVPSTSGHSNGGHQVAEGGGQQSNFTAGGNLPTNLNEFHECSRTRSLRKAFCPRIYAKLREFREQQGNRSAGRLKFRMANRRQTDGAFSLAKVALSRNRWSAFDLVESPSPAVHQCLHWTAGCGSRQEDRHVPAPTL